MIRVVNNHLDNKKSKCEGSKGGHKGRENRSASIYIHMLRIFLFVLSVDLGRGGAHPEGAARTSISLHRAYG